MERPVWLRYKDAGKCINWRTGPLHSEDIDTQRMQRWKVVHEAGLCGPESSRIRRRRRDLPQGSARGLRQSQSAGQQYAKVLLENEHAVRRYFI